MRRNEFTPPEFFQPEINQEMFGGKLRACTRSIFCTGASAEAKHHIANRAKVSFAEVENQALPLTKPKGIQILKEPVTPTAV